MKLYNPTAEERAFLYQEVQGLEPLIRQLGSVSVMVEQTKKRDYRVIFTVAPESMGMKIEATDSNLFDATIAAKEETEKVLNALVNSLPRDWNAETQNVKIPPELLH